MHSDFVAHTLEIAKLPHDIVFFGFDQDDVTPRYAREVRTSSQNYPNQTIFLGRARRYIGRAEYNKELSCRRVANVKAILRNSGIPEE